MEYKDYYGIMGVSKDASQDEIKRAYRKLARKYHPDVSKESDAEARFKEVNEAYEVLKDPEKRAAYDQLGSQWRQGQDFRPPPDWDAGFEFTGGGFTGADQSRFSDFFESLFGAGGPFRGAGHATGRRGEFRRRGEDHHAKVLISVKDAYQGATRTLQLQVPEVDPRGHVGLRPRTLNVKIPRGVTAGQQIRLSGQGGPGTGGAPDGDLFLEVEFEPDPLFRVEHRDVYVTLPVTPWEAALGGTVAVPTLGGQVELKVPAGSQSGQKLRLKGRGLPAKAPGDQYAVLRIVTPPADNEARRALYERMAREMPFDPRANLGE
ncbi:MAG TPA: DnaJ C-terminal domain-containing protein [Gammaproteobacteria bacterium]|nr:DnaJ C-terminal domain-containing protein [Gammaproteobacteria bacterium]